MSKEINTLNLANAHVMRVEARYLKGLVDEYDRTKNETTDKGQSIVNKIVKEKQRLNTCDRYDEEEVRLATLIKKRRQNGKK